MLERTVVMLERTVFMSGRNCRHVGKEQHSCREGTVFMSGRNSFYNSTELTV